MTTKAKLVSTIAAFCLVLALMVVGVLAASSATVDLGGSISFTAEDVVATVSVSASGSAEDAIVNGTGDYTKSFTSADATAAWTKNDINLTFANKDADIVITITVQNDSDERALTLTAGTLPKVEGDNINLKSLQYDLNSTGAKNLTTSPITVPASQSVEIIMTIEIVDANDSVTGSSWTADFTLANVAASGV